MNEEESRPNVLELCHVLMCEVMFMKVFYDNNGLFLMRLEESKRDDMLGTDT